jgi:hypothetical protein
VFLRLLPQLTPRPFTETFTRSDETNSSNKCNATKSASNVKAGPKQAPVTKAKKLTKPVMDNKNVPSFLVKLTAEDRDTFYFDIKKSNWDSYLERCVKGVRQYIVKVDLCTLPLASSG